MQEYTYYIIALVGVILAAVFILLLCRKWKNRKRYPDEMDLMEGHEFEFFCADLLRKKGFIEVEVTKGSGDYGVDILAEKEICVRGGFHCAPLAHRTIGTYNTGTVRISLGISNTYDEVIKVCKVINNL